MSQIQVSEQEYNPQSLDFCLTRGRKGIHRKYNGWVIGNLIKAFWWYKKQQINFQS